MSRFLAQLALLVTTSLFVVSLIHGPVPSDTDANGYYPPTPTSRKLVESNWQADHTDSAQETPPPVAQSE